MQQALGKLFQQHRIVFWYDSKQELRESFENLELDAITKIELINNEYGVKHRILRAEPDQKFLLYRHGPQPDDLDNWLLDVQLAHAEFRTDQSAIWLSDLDLGPEFIDVVQSHIEFFRSAARRQALKGQLKPDDTASRIRIRMLAVCAGSEALMDAIVEKLLEELADQSDERIRLIERCGLQGILWQQLARIYGYQAESPTIKDFSIELFKSAYAMGTDGTPSLSADALVLLSRWKNNRLFGASFEILSNEYAGLLGIEQDLHKRDFAALLELDWFKLIDQKILSDLVSAVAARTVRASDVTLWVRQRQQSYWFSEFRDSYAAVEYAAEFIRALDEASLDMNSLVDGVQRYARTWFRLDQLYRKFIYHTRAAGQATLLAELNSQVENLYSNNYLLKLGDSFQSFVEDAERWEALPVRRQDQFFRHWVQPFLQKDNKVVVIISDALRYEVGEELLGLIRKEDRFSAELEPALSMLPSYTQLGMAALLPHNELAIAANDTSTVLVDRQSSQGTANRSKLLKNKLGERTVALQAEELLAMNRDDSRALIRDHDLVYVHHNRIDATGHKRDSEERVFDAAEEALDSLVRLVKKLTNANVNNLLITADHGFIYQNAVLDESDFSSFEVTGKQVLVRDRRFVLGHDLVNHDSLHSPSLEKLGLKGEVEVRIPKSINRLRLKGAGSRFVHGGASLQEVVIPVLKVNKKRQSDVSAVEIEILRGSTSVITSGQLAVTMYQTSPVSDKVQGRTLRAGIYTADGTLISDSHELVFDLTSENPRDREFPVRFVLTRQADAANGQQVTLRLEENVPGTSQYSNYASVSYTMRRSFTSDFDF